MPREVMLCVTSYWVYCLTLKSAGLVAKLPFSKATLARERREINSFMPCTEAYEKDIMYIFNGYCKTIVRFAAINAWRDRIRRRQKEISLEYLLHPDE